MEVIFSYMSGLNAMDDILSVLNSKSLSHFKEKDYSDSIDKIMLILVTQNLNMKEQSEFKTKYAKENRVVAINFYLNSGTIERESLNFALQYIGFVIINSLNKNARLKKTGIDIVNLKNELKNFFESSILDNRYRINEMA